MDPDAILELGRQAGAEGEFETAYHMLMAAVHLADRRGDMPALQRVAALAKEQDEALEALRPRHRLSRVHAADRGHVALFETLATHIRSVELRHAAEQQRRRQS
jgi:hypothetical protein